MSIFHMMVFNHPLKPDILNRKKKHVKRQYLQNHNLLLIIFMMGEVDFVVDYQRLYMSNTYFHPLHLLYYSILIK